jgi:HSP20 family protein
MLPTVRKHRTLPGSFINEFFNDNFWPKFMDWENSFENSNVPAVNVEETDKAFLIDVVAPGLDKKDIQVTVDKNILSISSSKEDKKEGFLRQEFNFNSFSRSFSLPENTDLTKIKATHKNGILNISIPKVEVEAPKAIEIKIN